MGSKPGRGSVRNTGNKRATGQEQAAGSIGPTRKVSLDRMKKSQRKLSRPSPAGMHGLAKRPAPQEEP